MSPRPWVLFFKKRDLFTHRTRQRVTNQQVWNLAENQTSLPAYSPSGYTPPGLSWLFVFNDSCIFWQVAKLFAVCKQMFALKMESYIWSDTCIIMLTAMQKQNSKDLQGAGLFWCSWGAKQVVEIWSRTAAVNYYFFNVLLNDVIQLKLLIFPFLPILWSVECAGIRFVPVFTCYKTTISYGESNSFRSTSHLTAAESGTTLELIDSQLNLSLATSNYISLLWIKKKEKMPTSNKSHR